MQACLEIEPFLEKSAEIDRKADEALIFWTNQIGVPRLDYECLSTQAFGCPHVVLCHTRAKVSVASIASRIHLADQADSAAAPLATSQFSRDYGWQPPGSGFSTPPQVAD